MTELVADCIPKTSGPTPRNSFSVTLVGSKAYFLLGKESGKNSPFIRKILYFDLEVSRWTEVSPSEVEGATPADRYFHTASLVSTSSGPDSTIVVIGGFNGSTALADVSLLHLPQNGSGRHQWQPSVATNGQPTPKRHCHSASVVNNLVWVFGGGDGYLWINSVHTFDPLTLTWSNPTLSGTPPTGRLRHSAVTVGQKIYIFGGEIAKSSAVNDMHILDTASLAWSRPTITGVPPSPRASSCVGHVSAGLLFFGGFGGTSFLNDMHLFDLDSGSWSPIRFSVKTFAPAPRSCSASFVWCKQMHLCGGISRNTYLSDLVAFQLVPHTDFAANLQRDMSMLMKESLFADVTVVCGGQQFLAHRCILAVRCPFFSEALVKDGSSTITVDVKPEAFQVILTYLYSGTITPMKGAELLDLLVAARTLQLPLLQQHCESRLESSVDKSNAISVLLRTEVLPDGTDHVTAQRLRDVCIELVVTHLDEISANCPEFEELSDDLLLEIKRRADLGQHR